MDDKKTIKKSLVPVASRSRMDDNQKKKKQTKIWNSLSVLREFANEKTTKEK